MTRSDRIAAVLLVVIVAIGLVMAVTIEWSVPDFRGSKFEFTDPTCRDLPALCASPAAR